MLIRLLIFRKGLCLNMSVPRYNFETVSYEYYFSRLYLNCVIGLNLFIFSDWMINVLQVTIASARIMFCFVLSSHLICLTG